MKRIFKNKDFILSYIAKGNPKKQAVVLLPPGVGEASFFNDLIKILSEKYFVVSIDFPGAGRCVTKKEGSNVIGISKYITYLLKKINIKKPVLVGYSYGGSVAIQLSKSIKLKSLVLIATGEYFNIISKTLLSLIFFPTIVSTKVSKIYAKLITKKGNLKLSSCSAEQLKIVGHRWYNIIWIKLPQNYKSSIKTLIIKSKKDGIVKQSSFDKLEKIFTNNKIVNLNCGHFHYLDILKKNNYKEIIDFIDSS